jgi:alkylation response protein AidB-like acyl-CoA dehydrogenase
MQFGLSAEQSLYRDNLDRYLSNNASLDRVRRFADQNERRARDLIAGLVDLGIMAILIPETHGGVGLTALDACVVAEALGYWVAPVPFVANAVIVPTALRLAGTDAQQREWLCAIASGETIVGAALAELTGQRHDTGVTAADGRLHGKSRYALDFEADAWLVADTAGGLHMVRAGAKGLTRTRLETVDRTRPVGELVFDGVEAEALPDADALLCQRVLDVGRVVLAADTLGAAQYMLDQAVAYAKQREQFGRLIGSFQAVKHMCAEMVAQLEPTRSFVWYAGYALDALPKESHSVACHLKAHISEVGTFVAKTATEVHGGIGFTDLLGLHYWFKRIGFNRQMLGSPERLRMEAARGLAFPF